MVVSGVVEDASIGGAELAVDIPTGERLGLTTPRYLLVAYRGDRPALEDHLRAALRPETVVRFRGPGETPYLRHADAVLPQAQIKARFGEFSIATDEMTARECVENCDRRCAVGCYGFVFGLLFVVCEHLPHPFFIPAWWKSVLSHRCPFRRCRRR